MAAFLGTSVGALYSYVRAGMIPGPVLVGDRIRWPLSLAVWIQQHGIHLPGTFENDTRKRPTLAAYRAAVQQEVNNEARRLLTQIRRPEAKKRKHTSHGGKS